MSDFGPTLYGDPCRECGFAWSISAEDALVLLEAVPTRFATALQGMPSETHPGGSTWSVTGYVLHVADNLRIWAERLAGLALGELRIVAYDQDDLAGVRGYEGLSLPIALWSLERAVGDWKAAWELANTNPGLVLAHPEMGEQPLSGVIALVAHDAHHHGWDLERAAPPR